MLLSVFFAVNANAAAVKTPGKTLTYTLNETTGVLTISGTGRMYDFRATNLVGIAVPWASKKDLIKSVVVNEGVTYIGQYSFYNLPNLTTVSLPSSVTEIGGIGIQLNDESGSYGAFQACPALKTITLPEGLKTIDEYAFKECTALQNITFPSTLTTIGDSAFIDCSALKSVEFPDSLTSVGKTAFANCTKLTDVKYGSGLKSTGNRLFYQSGVKRVVFNPAITSIDTYCFYGTEISSIDIPDYITSIGIRSFGDTYFIRSVTVNNPNVTFEGIIGEDPFNSTNARTGIVNFYGHKGSTTETYVAEKGTRNNEVRYAFVSIDDCDHLNTFEKITLNPTCTTTGLADTICEDCQQVVKTNVVEALGHDYQIISTVDESEKNGHKIYSKECSRCSDKTTTIEHQLLPKEETEAPDTEEGTGSNIGGIIGGSGIGDAVNPHYVWVEGYYTYENSATCTRPGIEKYTCTYEGCGVVERNATRTADHTVDKWTVTKSATCTEDGERKGTCSVCKNEVTETVKATGHTLPKDPYKTEDKVDVDGHIYNTYKCEVCSADVVKPEHKEWLEEYYTPNVIVPARCTTDGRRLDTCNICPRDPLPTTRYVTLPSNGEHDWYVTDETEPDCTHVGKIFYACKNCNMTKSENKEALDHDYVLSETDFRDPTCTSVGYETYHCSRCSASKQVSIPALGHTPDEESYRVLAEPTCTEGGQVAAHCTVCNTDYVNDVKPLGHDYQDVTVPIVSHPGHAKVTPTCSRCKGTESSETKHVEWIEGYYTTNETTAPGCVVQGRTTFTCTYCDEKKTEVTSPALGHHYIATGTITNNYNISYRCEHCNTITLQNPHNILAMWDADLISRESTERTAVDNSCLVDANGDGYINARDYILLKNLAKVAPEPTEPTLPEGFPTLPERNN